MLYRTSEAILFFKKRLVCNMDIRNRIQHFSRSAEKSHSIVRKVQNVDIIPKVYHVHA